VHEVVGAVGCGSVSLWNGAKSVLHVKLLLLLLLLLLVVVVVLLLMVLLQ
jgi:hypothetical protein